MFKKLTTVGLAYSYFAYDKVRNLFSDDSAGLIAAIGAMIIIITLAVFLVASIFWIVGWAVLTVIGLFTTVGVVGYWATVGIGFAVAIVSSLLS